MTYTSGGLIQASDYNNFVDNGVTGINPIWGTGSGSQGYGQSTTLSNVSIGGTVTATQWADLVNRLQSIANHTGVAITSRTAPVTGNVIAVLANVSTDITNLNTYRSNAASSGATISPATGTWWQATNTSNLFSWTITTTHTITFASADQARYFFNSGGLIKWQVGKTSTGQGDDVEWNTLANTVAGVIYLSGVGTSHTINGVAYTGTTKIGGTGTPTTLATSTGFYSLTTTPTVLYDQFDPTTLYTTNHIKLSASVNSNTAPTVLTYTTQWIEGASSPYLSGSITGGAVNVGPTTTVNYIAPETTYISNTWGAISISATTSSSP
jgi:hypothetical protein